MHAAGEVALRRAVLRAQFTKSFHVLAGEVPAPPRRAGEGFHEDAVRDERVLLQQRFDVDHEGVRAALSGGAPRECGVRLGTQVFHGLCGLLRQRADMPDCRLVDLREFRQDPAANAVPRVGHVAVGLVLPPAGAGLRHDLLDLGARELQQRPDHKDRRIAGKRGGRAHARHSREPAAPRHAEQHRLGLILHVVRDSDTKPAHLRARLLLRAFARLRVEARLRGSTHLRA